MDELLTEFITETNERLDQLDADIVRLERDPGDSELLFEIFRLVHTIKGASGFLALDRLGRLAHAAETVLGRIRDGRITPDRTSVSLILETIDQIKDLLTEIEALEKEPPGNDRDLIARLEDFAEGGDARQPLAASDEGPSAAAIELDEPEVPLHLEQETSGAALPAVIPGRQRAAEPQSPSRASIRVSVDLLESLVDNVGELVLARNQLLRVAAEQGDSGIEAALAKLDTVTSDLRDGILKARMQPVRHGWAKLPRLVRDLGVELDKSIVLHTEGGETELDRQLLDAISDPLTHMIRNAADHGIEAPAVRRAAGKPETATIRLRAFNQDGRVIIAVADDGRGLDLAKVGGRAVERGLVTRAALAGMPPERIADFIFAPGFSTADAVSSVSGRGVGMDVVRTNVENFGGRVSVATSPGRGCEFSLSLPLTLAIISVLIVEADAQKFAVPQTAIVELLRIDHVNDARVRTIGSLRFLTLRGRLVPLVSLCGLLDLPDEGEASVLETVVVMQNGHSWAGIVVDRVHDTEEVVVHSTPPVVRDIGVYAGATILGDGAVIMILDPNRLVASVDMTPDEEGLPPVEEATLDEVADDSTAMLLVRGATDVPQAVPVPWVARLEEIDMSLIEEVEEGLAVLYRGRLLPLHLVNAGVPAVDGRGTVVVLSDGNRSSGLLVDSVIDIVEEPIRIDLPATRPGLLGRAVIAGCATEIIDAAHYLGRDGGSDANERRSEGFA